MQDLCIINAIDTGGASAEVFLGGLGNDTYTTGSGNDITLFNKGDGQDTFATGGTGSDALSLGGSGLAYAAVKGNSDVVGLVGYQKISTLTNAYWDKSTTGTTQSNM